MYMLEFYWADQDNAIFNIILNKALLNMRGHYEWDF